MHGLAMGALAGLAALAAGCLGEKIHRCQNGAICASDEACTEVPIVEGATLCGLPRLVEQCADKAQFDPCNYTETDAEPDGTCRSNVCVECLSVDVAGCAVPGWNVMTSNTTTNLLGVSVLGAAQAVAVGDNRTVSTYNGVTWTPSQIEIPEIPSNVSLTDIWALDASTWFVTTSAGELLEYRDGMWTEVKDIGTQLLAIDGESTSRIAVGFGGPLHAEGGDWVPKPTTPTVPLFGVWLIDANTAIAVGVEGSIFRYANGTWSADRAAVMGEPPLRAVSGSSPANIYAVGDPFMSKPNVLHYDGANWTRQALDGIPQSFLTGVYVAPDAQVFAVGSAGQLLHYDGTTWYADVGFGNDAMKGVDGSASANVIAVGNTGRVLRFTGKREP